MSQTWHLPLLTTDTLSDSRTYLNDAYASLRTMFSGSTAPSTPVAGQLFYDTDDKLIYVYDGATWRLIGDANLTNLGLLPKAGGAGNAMSGALYMGTQQIKGMANPTISTDGVNVSYADATYLKLAGGTLTGAVVMGANKITSSRSAPNDATELIRKDYADLMLTKSGGTMTGAIAMGANAITGLPTQTDGTDGANAASCSYLRGKLDTSTGHDHDGSDSKRVLATNIDLSSGMPWGRGGAVHLADGSHIHGTSFSTLATTSSLTPIASGSQILVMVAAWVTWEKVEGAAASYKITRNATDIVSATALTHAGCVPSTDYVIPYLISHFLIDTAVSGSAHTYSLLAQAGHANNDIVLKSVNIAAIAIS